ncbi:MAG: hypothetical protein EOO61_08115 [Hymenobacter sp.]|nr:MAG: hypothetical protein EOO61_08115 [Hymenobacter sp.]
MSRKKQKEVKDQLASDLRSMADILFEAGILTDITPLQDAANECAVGNPSEWGYWLVGMRIQATDYLPSYRNTIPYPVPNMLIEFNIRVEGDTLEQSCVEDPIKLLEAEWQISSSKTHVTSWHLDRNQGNIDEECKHFAHPVYHFQFGGKHLHERGPDAYGQLLFVEPPRLAHPPMDAILAIDFTISNFLPDIWHDLRRRESENEKVAQRAERYVRILRAAQKRFWRPYALAAAAHWMPAEKQNPIPFVRPENLVGREVWPQIVGHI